MIEIDDAICAALIADDSLVAMCGSADAITAQWPLADAVYSETPTGITNPDDYLTLSLVTPPRARVSFILVSPDEDEETPKHQDEYQIDIWSRSPRLNAAIAKRVRAKLDRQPIAATGLRVTESYCTSGPELLEDDTRLYHKVMNLHVTWIG